MLQTFGRRKAPKIIRLLLDKKYVTTKQLYHEKTSQQGELSKGKGMQKEKMPYGFMDNISSSGLPQVK